MRTPTMTLNMTLELPNITDESTVQDAQTLLNQTIHRIYDNDEESFSRTYDLKPTANWYDTRKAWMVIFFVEGNSEGHYIHVDTVDRYETTTPQTTGTCFP